MLGTHRTTHWKKVWGTGRESWNSTREVSRHILALERDEFRALLQIPHLVLPAPPPTDCGHFAHVCSTLQTTPGWPDVGSGVCRHGEQTSGASYIAMATGLGGDMAEVQSAIWEIPYLWGLSALWVAPSGPCGAVLWEVGLRFGWGQTRLLAAVEKSGTQPAAKTIVIADKEFFFRDKKMP